MPATNGAGTGRFTLTYSIIPTNGFATLATSITLDQYFSANGARKATMPEFPEIPLTGYHI